MSEQAKMWQGEAPGPYDSAISDRLMGLVRLLGRQERNPGDFPVEDLMQAQRMTNPGLTMGMQQFKPIGGGAQTQVSRFPPGQEPTMLARTEPRVIMGDAELADMMARAMATRTGSIPGPSEADLARIPTRQPPPSEPTLPDFSVNPASLREASPAMLMALFGSGGPSQEVSSVQTPSRNPVRRAYAPPAMLTANVLSPVSQLPPAFQRPVRR